MTYFGLMRQGQTKAENKGLEKTAVKSLLLVASNMSPTEIYTHMHVYIHTCKFYMRKIT